MKEKPCPLNKNQEDWQNLLEKERSSLSGYSHHAIKTDKSFDEVQKLFKKHMKWINSFVPMEEDLPTEKVQKEESSVKKGEDSRKKTLAKKRGGAKQSEKVLKDKKMKDDDEKEELRAHLDIVPRDDVAINVESLATGYPIVDWKTHAIAENKMYYEIIRGDGSTKYYKIFTVMLNDFDRQDVLELYRLVKEIYESTSPEGYDRLLWGDLITLFESIHVLLMDTGVAIHMLVEKKYPLTQAMLSRMLSRRLEVDHESEMAFELLRFTRSQVEK
ncbi:hypothetical protein Tco_0901944 [Tanacetum coccineum]